MCTWKPQVSVKFDGLASNFWTEKKINLCCTTVGMVTGCYDDDFEVTEEEEGAIVGAEENEDTLLAAEGFDDSLKVRVFKDSGSNFYTCVSYRM